MCAQPAEKSVPGGRSRTSEEGMSKVEGKMLGQSHRLCYALGDLWQHWKDVSLGFQFIRKFLPIWG